MPAETDHEPALIDLDGVPATRALDWLSTMLLIRTFEESCERLVLSGKIPGGVHSAAGQEAVAVGIAAALQPQDIVAGSHRSHHHALAKGLPPREIMAELFGRRTGCNGGRAGHMHLADFARGMYGSNGIVGAGVGIALGAALAAQRRGDGQVAVGFFGDGGANTGRVWEFTNLAALWRLPLLIVCENNLYAVETRLDESFAGESIAARARGFALPAVQVDGQDVAAVAGAAGQARQRAAAGDGPTFIEALTYRLQPHSVGEQDSYRTAEEVAHWRTQRDPILRLRATLNGGAARAVGWFEDLSAAAADTVRDAVDFADASPWPDPATADHDVTAVRAGGTP